MLRTRLKRIIGNKTLVIYLGEWGIKKARSTGKPYLQCRLREGIRFNSLEKSKYLKALEKERMDSRNVN